MCQSLGITPTLIAPQPAASDQIAVFNSPDLYRSSPESGDLQCTPDVSTTMIHSCFTGWWNHAGLIT